MSYITDNAIIDEILDTLHSYNLNICQVCEKKSGEVDSRVICNEHFLFCEEAIRECLERRKADWEAEVARYNNDLKYQGEANEKRKTE